MKGFTHILLGMFAGSLYFDFFGAEGLLLKLGFAGTLLLGALLPDIDEKESSVSRKFPGLAKIVTSLSKHRGIFHSIWPILIMLVLVFFIKNTVADFLLIGLTIGYASHLAGDSITKQGIKPLHPIHKAKIKGLIKTGGLIELVIAGLIVVWFLIEIVLQNHLQLVGLVQTRLFYIH